MIFLLNISDKSNPYLIVGLGKPDAEVLRFKYLYRVMSYNGLLLMRYLVEALEPVPFARYVVRDGDGDD